ncbi:MAG: ABC transporter ATP-binding protein [Muribaculaceae bacterium]|nr:ABC transporter ATP-binding protein [Muribaculaceae bacterium]
MIECNNLTFSYRKATPILKEFNLTLENGGIYGLLGKNGAGKSTLLYLMCGLLTPAAGEVLVNGVNVRRRLPSTLRDIFLVPEEFDLPSITLEDYCRINAPFYPDFSMEALKRNLETFEMPEKIHLGYLSMGQKKKAYMCFALACNTPILIMDEPTNGLDITSKVQFRRFLAAQMNENRIILISTHQVHDVELLLDHIVIVDNRQLLLNRKTSEITSRLRFFNTLGAPDTDDPRLLYSARGVGGFANIARREDPLDEETDLNLESLYELCCRNPKLVENIFNPDNTSEHEQLG